MGANSWTTDDLVDDIVLLSNLPLSNQTFTSQQLIRMATLELQLKLVKQILSSRGGYYMVFQDQELAQDGIYPIPGDSVSGTLANVELVQSTTIIQVNQIEESEQFCTTAPTSTSYGYFLRGNYIHILPIPNIGVPRFWYFKRTSDLIPVSSAAQITAINGNVISVSSLPSTFQVDTLLDGVGDNPPFNLLIEDLDILEINGTDLTVDVPPLTLSEGDWLALSGQTPVPQIPVEFRLLLTQRVICKAYEAQGYLDKLRSAREVLKEYEKDTLSLITPRVKSQSKIINPINGGFLAGNSSRFSNFPAGRSP